MSLGGGCTSAQRRILTVYFATSRKTKDVLLGPVFRSLHQLFLSSLPSVPAYGSPRAKPQEMRYWYDPREVRKGHLFHRCRWQNSRRKPRGQGKYERGRALEEMRYETSKKAGARFVCGLLIVKAKAHTASQTAVFSKNTFSFGSCCEKEVDSSAPSLLWINMEGIRNWSAQRRRGWGAPVSASNPSPNPRPKTLKIGRLAFGFDVCCAAEH